MIERQAAAYSAGDSAGETSGDPPGDTRSDSAGDTRSDPAVETLYGFPGDAKRGILITFEGGEGVGKTTHLKILADHLAKSGREVISLREPGGTVIGEQVRAILLNSQNSAMSEMTELLLYEAARAQLVQEVILPALGRGAVVLLDRYTDSTLAYQGAGRQMDAQTVRLANQLGSSGVVPDRTVLLVDDTERALSRARKDGADRLEAEGLAFHQRVGEGFRQIQAEDPGRVRLVELAPDKEQTAALVLAQLSDLFS